MREGAGRLVLTTTLALAAFAANSVLCRLALVDPLLDPASFSAIRIGSGAVCLGTILLLRGKHAALRKPDAAGAFWLAGYAVPFSYAYVQLSAGTGALLLFGAVQLSMLLGALLMGERLAPKSWAGLAAATGGLVYLILPGVSAPSAVGAALMTVAGVCWGVYSLRGRSSTDPLTHTAGNFVWATPLVLLLCLIELGELHAEWLGVWLALGSGVLASGLGYALWYAALPLLSRTRAGILQLCVPIIASAYGVLFMAEALTQRLVVATVFVLGGVALSLHRSTTTAESPNRNEKRPTHDG